MGTYDDILHLPHHRSGTHPQMTPEERAAQFAPFAALSGMNEALREAELQNLQRLEPETESEQEPLWLSD